MSNNIKKKVLEMEAKLLFNHCDECSCSEGCAKKDLNDAIENRLKILKGDKTVLK